VISAGFLIAVGYAATLAVTFVVFRDPLLAVFATPGTTSRRSWRSVRR
jgi:hypothetical protein